MMDLALLVYAISILGKLSTFCVFIAVVAAIIAFIAVMYRYAELTVYDWDGEKVTNRKIENQAKVMKTVWTGTAVAAFFVLANIIIPTERTAYTMVGAYAAQKVAENPEVQGMSNKVLTIINQKLDQYVEDGVAAAEKRVKDAK